MNLDERLRAKRPYTVNGRGTGLPDRLVNPDGPEAADALAGLKDALETARDYVNDTARGICISRHCDTALKDLAKIDAALTTTKIEKDGQNET